MPGRSDAKDEVRARMRARLADLLPAERRERSTRLLARLRTLPAWREARSVLLFAPLSAEPDLDGLWAADAASQEDDSALTKKRCYYPRMAGRRLQVCEVRSLKELVSARWGLREPAAGAPTAALTEIDLALVPGLAFTASGSRLGRGGGFYDRLLTEIGFRARTIGVGFDFQLLPTLPLEAHDAAVSMVLTD